MKYTKGKPMQKLINNHVVFSFDNPYQIHCAAQFYHFLDVLRAMNKLKYDPVLGTGYYMNTLEPIVMLDYNDFQKHVVNSVFVENQESFLLINPKNTHSFMYQAGLLYNKTNKFELIGDFKEFDGFYKNAYDAWTMIGNRYYSAGS
jgi:hypothetical protein